MRLLTFLLILLFVSGCQQKETNFENLVNRDGIIYEKYSNKPFSGMVTGGMQGRIKNGKPAGVAVKYHENGQLRSEDTYKNGEFEGLARKWWKTGCLSSEGTYKDGKREGIWRIAWACLAGNSAESCYSEDEEVDMSNCR